MEQDTKTTCVKDIMTKNVITVDASTTVNQAAKMMEDTGVGSIIVSENYLLLHGSADILLIRSYHGI